MSHNKNDAERIMQQIMKFEEVQKINNLALQQNTTKSTATNSNNSSIISSTNDKISYHNNIENDIKKVPQYYL